MDNKVVLILPKLAFGQLLDALYQRLEMWELPVE